VNMEMDFEQQPQNGNDSIYHSLIFTFVLIAVRGGKEAFREEGGGDARDDARVNSISTSPSPAGMQPTPTPKT